MENNESPKETIERELKEELNISLKVKFVNKFNHVYGDLRIIENVFEAKVDKLIYFPTEGAGAAFFTKEDFIGFWVRYTLQAFTSHKLLFPFFSKSLGVFFLS